MHFEDLDLSDDILDAIYAMHFDECTPIQEQAIPIVLQGRDLIAIAQTGTGKTAAYLLPVIDLLADLPAPDAGVNCIVMAPTRELAQQIEQQMDGFSYYLPISSLAIYGGTDGATFARQQRAMREGADVVIATPGRLQALLQMGGINLGKVKYFILDEADRMLDMGFYDDIMRIAAQLPTERQTLLFSATMPPRIRKLAKDILSDPVEIKIAPSRPVEKIAQSAIMCGDAQKDGVLLRLLKERHGSKVIVFASSKLGVRDLTRSLRRSGIKAAEIHSDLGQKERDDTIHDFRAERLDVLVATDLLARGIDIDDISMVVNYDVPREPEDYVHRVGRTGRANAEGTAVTLVSPRDKRAFSRVESTLKIKIPLEDAVPGADAGRSDRSATKDRRRQKKQDAPKGARPGTPNASSAPETTDKETAEKETDKGNSGKKHGNRRYKHRRPSSGKDKADSPKDRTDGTPAS
ncbi:DEAD/DEAH box helicase [uncultured Muribaculum sp.]|uniref:DEAD/DEAH box helicase n=1 Tax=uncultured Muribaculum sp. TaxID=1918613 RepID=UPI0026010502|nr:DEAD/DEAH box helicase [uncultured Muribaculum sp.]